MQLYPRKMNIALHCQNIHKEWLKKIAQWLLLV
jgi:hypothetical protein